jgi:hypothetical protein
MTKPWRDIKAFYAELVGRGTPVQGMLRLVETIEQSRFASGVHGETSMHDLCLTQIAGMRSVSDPYLRISPRLDGTIEFRYVDTHVKAKQWQRVANEDEAFPRLVHFFDQLHWFAAEGPESSQS